MIWETLERELLAALLTARVSDETKLRVQQLVAEARDELALEAGYAAGEEEYWSEIE